MASRSCTKRGKPRSLRQSPAASSQNLSSVDDNSSSQASWSSDEDHTHFNDVHAHRSPTLSWTSDIEGPNETGLQDITGNQDGGGLIDPTLLEAQFETLNQQTDEAPLDTAELANIMADLLPPHASTPTAPPTPPLYHTGISLSPPQASKLSPNSHSPATIPAPSQSPIPSNSPSPIPIPSTSPSPIPILQTSPSPIPVSRNSPCLMGTPPRELPVSGQVEREGEETKRANGLFSSELDEQVVAKCTAVSSRTPHKDEISFDGMKNESKVVLEPESDPELTLKPASTNPFMQFSEVQSTAHNFNNPFSETPTNPFDLSPPPRALLSNNPFDDDVITNSDDVVADEPVGEGVPQLVVKGEGTLRREEAVEWSENSSTAEDTLASLEETYCISLSVFQQGKDSPSSLSAQYDKLSDLSSLLDKGSSDRSSQLDRLSEVEELSSRPESREKSDGDTVSSFPSSVDLSLVLEAEPLDNNLHPQENYYENEVH